MNAIVPTARAVWFATDGGVVRYDRASKEYRWITVENGLPIDLILCLTEAPDRAWVGCEGALASVEGTAASPQTWRALESAPIFRVEDIFFADGGLYAEVSENPEWGGFAKGGIYRFVLSSRQWVRIADYAEVGYKPAALATEQERRMLLERAKADKDQAAIMRSVSEQVQSCTAALRTDFGIWAGTSYGLYRKDPETKRWAEADYEGSPDITCLAADGKALWVGTRDEGAFLYDPAAHTTTTFALPTDLPSTDTTGLALGKRYLWVGLRRGLCAVDLQSRQVKQFTSDTGLPGEEVLCLAFQGDTVFFVIKDVGLCAMREDERRVRTIVELPAQKIEHPRRLLAAGKYLWLATEKGLMRIEPEGAEAKLFETDKFAGQDNERPMPLLALSDGRMAIGYGNELFILDPEKGTYMSALSVKGEYGIYDLASWSGKDFAACLGGGLFELDIAQGKAEKRPVADPMISTLCVVGQELWMGTPEYEGVASGVQATDAAGNTRMFDTTQGLPANDVRAIVADESQVWVMTRSGLLNLPITQGRAQRRP